MKAKVLWSPQAREDLLDIYLTIGLDDPSAAERFVNLIEAQAALLADHPRLGPRRPEILPTTRVLIERPYLILYETHPNTDDAPVDTVEVVRVIDGRRDLTALF